MPVDREDVRGVVEEFGRLSVPIARLSDADDLYAAGMTSHASVSVMLGLESTYDLEFPDQMLTRDVFGTIDSIAAALSVLLGANR